MRMACDIKFQRALHLSDDNPDKSWRLKRVGELAYALYDKTHENADLDRAIAAYEAAVRLTPDGHQCQAELRNALGVSLRHRFEYFGNIADIENAIFAIEASLLVTPDNHADKPGRLTNLGACFMRRFERSGDLMDIDKAISAQEQAEHLIPDSHSHKPDCLHNLGYSFLSRFEHSGNLVDIDGSISNHKRAVHLTPDSHASKPGRLNSLGSSFLRRFERSGNLVDIDMAISNHNQAVHLSHDGNVNKPAYLSNLGSSFLSRFERSGDLVDSDQAISNHERAVHLIPDDHASKPGYLNNLGNSFARRFKLSGDLADIDKAISNHERAVHLTLDGHTSKPGHLSNLGNSFTSRFEHSGNLVDIDKAVSSQERAVHLTPDHHANKPAFLNNLSTSFLHRFEHSGNLIDIDKAISFGEQAVHLIPDGHAGKPGYLENLGTSFWHRFAHSRDLVDCGAAISHFRRAAISSTGSPSKRFRAALKWARLAGANGSSALQGYTVALDLLPQVAWLGQTIPERHKELSSVGAVANEAAAAAISAEQYDTALEWLEQGRSIVWSQLLHLRTPVDTLHDVEPILANELMRVSRALEHASSRGGGSNNLSTPPDRQFSMEQVAQDHRRLAEEWEILVKRVQDIPGFEDFLRPRKLAQLQSAARMGPVVVITVHEHRCDALVLMAGLDEVVHIPLDQFSYHKAQQLYRSLNQLLLTAGVRVRDTRATRMATTATGGGFRSILSVLWSCVVKPVLDGLAFTVSCLSFNYLLV